MTVCQYYLEGRCRFGQNCRNEHSFNNVSDDRNNKTFTSTQQLKNIIRQIVCEVVIAEKGGQWPLSCFAPIKEGPNIPEWEDISPEEIRWKMYEARNNGTLNQCINEVNQLYSDAEKRRNALKQPSVDKINLIVNMLKGKKETVNISNPFVSSGTVNNTSNIFGGSPTGSQNIFTGATCGNVFGTSTQPTASAGNIFTGNSNNFTTQNIFGGSNSPANFNQNIFSNSQTSTQSLFSNTTPLSSNPLVSSQNIFTNSQTGIQGNSTQKNLASYTAPMTTGLFSHQGTSTSLFGSPVTDFQTRDNLNQNKSIIFGGSPADILRAQNSVNKYTDFKFEVQNGSTVNNQVQGNYSMGGFGSSQPNAIDYSVYSKIEDLSSEELQAYAAPTFTFGKIPLKPPPLESCK